MVTWLVRYRFRGPDNRWVESFMYKTGNSPDQAKAAAQVDLNRSGATYEILSVNMVGEGR